MEMESPWVSDELKLLLDDSHKRWWWVAYGSFGWEAVSQAPLNHADASKCVHNRYRQSSLLVERAPTRLHYTFMSILVGQLIRLARERCFASLPQSRVLQPLCIRTVHSRVYQRGGQLFHWDVLARHSESQHWLPNRHIRWPSDEGLPLSWELSPDLNHLVFYFALNSNVSV